MMSSTPAVTRNLAYHLGEIQAQDKAGTRGAANELLVGRSSRLNFARNHDAFLAAQSFAAVTFVDVTTTSQYDDDNENNHHHDHNNVWVTPLFGQAGDITATSETDLNVALDCIPVGDPLHNVPPGTPLSLIAIDLSRRIRHRINGVAGESTPQSAEGRGSQRRLVLKFKVEEYSPNCPKYINRRELVPSAADQSPINRQAIRQRRNCLTDEDQLLIHEADTLWIGSHAPGVGADCNHRGGKPGFIRVIDPSTIEWPEYRGNGMFYTSGNLEVNDRAGVTIVDFTTGNVLQMTGRATVDWHHDGSFEGATRVIRLRIAELVRTDNATHHRWTLLDYSPYNPVLRSGDGDGEAAEDDNRGSNNRIVTVTLAKIVQESDDVKTFRWIAPRRIPFLPGQYATFEFANVPGGQPSEIRTWTLSETPNSILGDNTLDITVKRKGLVTSWLHDHVQVGLEARLHGIQGDLTALAVDDDDGNKKPIVKANHLLLVSAGIGITPNVAMIRGIGAFRLQDQVTIRMIHVERYEKDLLFQSELIRRSQHYPHFTMTNVITSRDGRLTRERLQEALKLMMMMIVPNTKEQQQSHHDLPPPAAAESPLSVQEWQQQQVYLCGPTGFMTATTELLVQLGVPPHQIHTESFDF